MKLTADSICRNSTCQSASVTKGMKGCSIFSMFSKTYNKTARAVETATEVSLWYKRVLLASIYLKSKKIVYKMEQI